MVDSRPDKKPRMDRGEAFQDLDNQLQLIEHKRYRLYGNRLRTD